MTGRWWSRAPLIGDGPPSWPPVRHPFQVFLMAVSVVSGVTGLLAADAPPPLHHALGYTLLLVWQATLAVCGVLGLLAAYTATRDELWSYLLERVSLFPVGGMALVYGVVVMAAAGRDGVFSGLMALGWGAACLARGVQVQRTLSWLRTARRRLEQGEL